MTVKGFPQIFHYVGPDVDGAADDPVSDGLDSLAAEAELGTLEVRHLEVEIVHQIEVD